MNRLLDWPANWLATSPNRLFTFIALCTVAGCLEI